MNISWIYSPIHKFAIATWIVEPSTITRTLTVNIGQALLPLSGKHKFPTLRQRVYRTAQND